MPRKKQTGRSTMKDCGCAFLDDSQLIALHFRSEEDFDKGVDVLFGKRTNFLVAGFDTLMIPKDSFKEVEGLLKSHAALFDQVPIVTTSELTKDERKKLRRELASSKSLQERTEDLEQ